MADTEGTISRTKLNFIRQQGFSDATEQSCPVRYPALMFQPRWIGGLVLVGLLIQAWWFFLGLSAILWWNVLVPARNLFDALYKWLVARPRGKAELPPAPPPRRFAQGMAATFMLAVGLSLLAGATTVAVVWEVLLVVAVAALVFGKFCLGSFVYLLLTGRGEFARRTLPWSRRGDA